MILKIIMIAGALFGFLYGLKLKGTYSRVINWAMVISVGATFINSDTIKVDAYYLFALVQIGVLVYGIAGIDFSQKKRITIISSAILSLLPLAYFLYTLPFIFSVEMDVQHQILFKYALLAGIGGTLQLGIFIFGIKSEIQNLKEEIGFLVILSADALTRIISCVQILIDLP